MLKWLKKTRVVFIMIILVSISTHRYDLQDQTIQSQRKQGQHELQVT